MEESYQKKVILVITAIIILGLVMTYWLIDAQRHSLDNRDMEFAGAVYYIAYDIKQYPMFTINNKRYYIGAGYDTNHQIEVGDSIVKKRGSDIYTLIKHKTKQVITFTR